MLAHLFSLLCKDSIYMDSMAFHHLGWIGQPWMDQPTNSTVFLFGIETLNVCFLAMIAGFRADFDCEPPFFFPCF